MSVKRVPMRILLLLLVTLVPFAVKAQAGTLNDVKARGVLICGTSADVPGFGMMDQQGNWSGFDVDYCRAIAAAVFDDPTKVKFVNLPAKNRAAALQSGMVDVLASTMPWTLSREAPQGLMMTAVNFFDGQGFMVHQKLNIASVLELSGASICVQQGTSNELNLADFFQAHQMQYQSVTFPTAEAALKAYVDGGCDAISAEASTLYAEHANLPAPADSTILPEIISKQPFALAVRQGDDQWFDLVRWVHFAMVDAEEAGINSRNVDDKMTSEVPEIRRLFGVEGNFGEALGLTKDWAYRIIKHIGNYGEVFDRNLGDGSSLKIRRGLNALWSRGGLQYAPPLR